MKYKHRTYVVVLLENGWAVFNLKKKVSCCFKTKIEADEYKKYLRSR